MPPEQPSHSVSDTERTQCREEAGSFADVLARAPFALLVYATSLPTRWLLGQTAAHHGVPVVVAGLGRAWHGFKTRMLGARRAAQILSALVPRLPIILTDGTDVFVANAPNAKQAADALAIASSGAVLGGGECNSFPKCYTPVYANHTEFLACRNASHQTGQACYPNSGFLLASSTTLAESLMPAFEALALQFSNTSHPGPEAGNPDQAALHRLYAEAQDSSVRVQIDSTSEFVLNLYGCPADWRASAKADPHYVWLAPHHYTRRKPGNVNYHYCFDEPHEPLRHLSLDNATLSYAYSESGVVRFPLLLHANGNHARLMDARVRMRELESRLWTANHAGRYPILFIDAAKQVAGGCTLGNLSALASLAKR